MLRSRRGISEPTTKAQSLCVIGVQDRSLACLDGEAPMCSNGVADSRRSMSKADPGGVLVLSRWWRSIAAVLGFFAILITVALAPRDPSGACPAGKDCGSLLTLSRPSPDPAFLHYLLPILLASAGAILLIVLRRTKAAPPSAIWLPLSLIGLGVIAALVLPSGFAPDPYLCGDAFPRHLPANECLTWGGHADPRMALRYLALLAGLVSAAVVALDAAVRPAGPPRTASSSTAAVAAPTY
jgi:hypothetical protein